MMSQKYMEINISLISIKKSNHLTDRVITIFSTKLGDHATFSMSLVFLS